MVLNNLVFKDTKKQIVILNKCLYKKVKRGNSTVQTVVQKGLTELTNVRRG